MSAAEPGHHHTRKKHNMNTNYNPDTIPPNSGVKPKAIGKRAALAALLGAAALYAAPMALTTPLANADSAQGAAYDCGKSGGTWSSSQRSDGSLIESCTTTDKNGVKTQCSYIDGKKQGCINVPRVNPPGTGPQLGRANDRLNLVGQVTDVQLQSPGSETQPGAGAAG
jgi:hypothetical protein